MAVATPDALERRMGNGLRPNTAPNQILLVKNNYQPGRETRLLSDPNPDNRICIQPDRNIQAGTDINDEIKEQSYDKTMIRPAAIAGQRGIPFRTGVLTSFVMPLRVWMEHKHPEDFKQLVANVHRWKDWQYRVMADTGLHFTAAPENSADVNMWVRIGNECAREDYGAYPYGTWLAETQIDRRVVRVLAGNGAKFTALRSDQLIDVSRNPMYVLAEDENNRIEGELAVIHFDAKMSGPYSFDDSKTLNAERLLAESRADKRRIIADERREETESDHIVALGSDGEMEGHHKAGRDQTLNWGMRPGVLRANDYKAFDIRKALEDPNHSYTEIIDNSSWSCTHGGGRQVGAEFCGCDGGSDPVDRRLKRQMYGQGRVLDRMLTAALYEQFEGVGDWRELFIPLAVTTRKSVMVYGDTYAELADLSRQSEYGFLADNSKRDLFLAWWMSWLSKQSCRSFFAGVDGLERKIGTLNQQDAMILFERATGVKVPVLKF